ncbi:LegC family aminotransferase [Sapientia aquatica]|uniref:GDP-perosamine synthase n=1 Tax=Sapientia aquatica TaxID=1549640 RepID=A0A4R5W0I3_9BURK|nr:LegC family aminotransferase [Sapientia aquatica]TDK65536.1 LegC family aminotransferase [Sapientia aquatica]
MHPSHQDIIDFIRALYPSKDSKTDALIALHAPLFAGNEKKYLLDCIDSTFVSSVGAYVTQFEQSVTTTTGAKHAIATVNGTAALHIALLLAGVKAGEEVITQPLSFVATCNAIAYCNAKPVFVDVNRHTLGMNPASLLDFLSNHCLINSQGCFNKATGRRIAAVLPMHTFGLPCDLEQLIAICAEFNLPLIEDAAESLGSYYHQQHTGTFGLLGTLSFNGNKTITTGGGGMILTNDDELARRAKHLTTTAKLAHPYEFVHDDIGYNYRLPNINAALGCAQIEMLPQLLASKRKIAQAYASFFADTRYTLVKEPDNTHANYWLNAVICPTPSARDQFLTELIAANIMVRPIWTLVNTLPMYADCQAMDLANAQWLVERVVNLPSSARFDLPR